MKNLFRITTLFLVITIIASLCACSKPAGNMSSAETETIIEEAVTSEIVQQQTNSSGGSESGQNVTSSQNETSSQNQTDSNVSTPQNNTDNNTSSTSSEEPENPNASTQPKLTLCVSVAKNTYVIGGTCSLNTEYIMVGGDDITATKITPANGEKQNYFIGQVKVSAGTVMEIQGKEVGKDLSKKIKRAVSPNPWQDNMMTQGDYKPVFGLESRSHYYSAILTYSKSNFLTEHEKQYANANISMTVNAANSCGAKVVYLVIPSSAAVYPETVPSEYGAATGETLYKAFKTIAENNGATVLYPLDTMKAHKNDGNGYKIYSHTDSHWTTYGAYWGVYELMNHISTTNSKFAAAKPRTVSEMQFYTAELYGGDMLFSFGDGTGFENYSQAGTNNGKTKITGINELTTLYSLQMPTDTLSLITRNKKSVYLTKANEGATTFTNQSGSGLPSAVIVRDSFGRTAFDMVNDRFSKITWLAENDYENIIGAINQNSSNLDYVIYIVSERNLLKVMLNANVPLNDGTRF